MSASRWRRIAPWRLEQQDIANVTSARAFAALISAIVCHAVILALFLPAQIDDTVDDDPNQLSMVRFIASARGDENRPQIGSTVIALPVLMAGAYSLWALVRYRYSASLSWRLFCLCWLRASLLGLIVAPAACLLTRWAFGSVEMGFAAVAAYLLIAPAALSPRILPTRQFWRPVCPECGHSVAYSRSPRCNECGEAYPSSDPYYRRWAIHRLLWDQKRRSIVPAYLMTTLWLAFRPSRAAWRLANPDRLGRPARWMLAHALAPLLFWGLMLLSIGVRESYWPIDESDTRGGLIVAADPRRPPALNNAFWGAESVLGWTFAISLFPVALGVALSFATPFVQPAARYGMAKWSLYATSLPVLIALAVVAYTLIPFVVGLGFKGYRFASLLTFLAVIQIMAPWPAFAGKGIQPYVAIYAVWWAIGYASQPYLRRRGFLVFLLALGAYLLTWKSVAMLFDLGGFMDFVR